MIAAGVYPAYLGWDGWILKNAAPRLHSVFSGGILRDFVPVPFATPETFDFDKDPAQRRAAMSVDIDAKPDLRGFFARGGKLILYHGWSDAAIPPEMTIEFRNAVLARSGPKATSAMRLFMVPGMQHCVGGTGPWSIGQLGAPRPKDTPDDNVAAAIEAWVEHDRTPETLVGAMGRATLTGTLAAEGTLAAGPHKDRLLCAYPKRAVFRSGGNPDVAASYICRLAVDRRPKGTLHFDGLDGCLSTLRRRDRDVGGGDCGSGSA